jgi:hypothetical protein
MFRQVMAASLAGVLAVGGAPVLLAQQGAISGKATDEAHKPYPDYSVRLREPQSGQIFGTQPLDQQGRFAFSALTLGQSYIVELIDTTKNNRVVCTEGPFGLSQQQANRSDVNIDCGAPPAALWILAAAAGLTAGVVTTGDTAPAPTNGVVTTNSFFSQSNSR